ncbi:hypothetical protein PIB30_009844 [Stylosanthes scabra]|uniref:Uncharacterized protein n=1 Tax=Stylosanthes scabra TaxID=79078 RepID=A0ABU6Q581_9FABA|nr:hypothetical protein [Stylosanthes scabra]
MRALGEDAEYGDRVKGEREGAHLGEKVKCMVGVSGGDEDSVVDGVFVGVGDLIEEVDGMGEGGKRVEVEEGIEEEVGVGGGGWEEARHDGSGVELGGGADGGGAGAAAKEGAEVEGRSTVGVWECPSHTIYHLTHPL